MHISVETDPVLLDTEVLIRCVEIDEKIESIISSLALHERKVVGKHGDETLYIPISEVLYFEHVERRTFAYTLSEVFEVPYKLYELEEQYSKCGFERIAKNCILNLCRVNSLIPYVGGRLLATLSNGEKVLVSRNYSTNIKARLSA